MNQENKEMSTEKWGHTVVKYLTDDSEKEHHGVLIQVDNGDTQYLTMEEYGVFLKENEVDV